jgi:hypothetical protein
MLASLTRTSRVKAAVVLAALYVLCNLAPSAAFAFSPNPGVAHCLVEEHVGVHNHDGDAGMHAGGKVHVHADGAAHVHHGDAAAPPPPADDGKTNVAMCCSLFSVVALAGEPVPDLGLYSPACVILPVLDEAPSGRGPERINRPPIA